MDRFNKETIEALSLIFVGLTIIWYLVVAFLVYRRGNGQSVNGFLRYRTSDEENPGFTAQMLHASLMGSAFSLASAIYAYLNWAATDGAFVLWSPITWALGALVLYLLRVKIFQESRGTWTLHGFLQNKYNSVALKRWASVITSVVFLLQVAAEVYVGLSVLQVFVGADVPLWILCLVAGTVFLSYSAVGGLPAVLITDWLSTGLQRSLYCLLQ